MIMLTDVEGVTRKSEVGFRIWTSKEFHRYQVVGRKLPSASDEHPKIYRMKLWATNEVRAKSSSVGKWFLLNPPPGEIQFVAKDVKEAASKGIPSKCPVELETYVFFLFFLQN
ncbi:Ribosomal protein L18ae/LX family protein [Prunus dulcis]|uniref:Ribosomal protein L18ae/LX family protein n=1 Tax=Prunus dulcis TaxID=3755 RepID=A0A4Y1QV23_PRUDU|nr:Ribosomal protein L18ae/LX family protein [Prunus dulcis]